MLRIRFLAAATAAVALCSLAVPVTAPPPFVGWTLVGWNDLGMHCMDADYSVFSILPPYNTVQAQLIDDRGDLVTDATGVVVTYQAVADPEGSINRSSAGKTNFWQFAQALYGGPTTPDLGLAGHDMPGASNTPRSMTFDAGAALFSAEGVPITPFDDLGRKRPYPMMRLVASTTAGAVLATTDVVLPVSDEMDCSLCHASGTEANAAPFGGWIHDPVFERDYRLNILQLHDDLEGAQVAYQAALRTAGYDPRGLRATADAGTPILCARCHGSNALPGTGIIGIAPLTEAIHARHAMVLDPVTGQTLDASTNRGSCYRCHPGSDTRCLRGAMGSAVAADASLAIQCQDCHGSIREVGAATREGWLDQPTCQACHTGTALRNNGQIRYDSVFDANGMPRVAVDATFATDADVPAPGFSLYRFSVGHGGLRCEACHGSTHAVYPAAHGNDNLQSEALQGHVGTLIDCTACHDRQPRTVTGGPHGMHPVGQAWVDDHGDIVENLGAAQCRACHGTDYRGTELSRSHGDRSFATRYGTRSFPRGTDVTCYSCHNGPNSDDPSRNAAPTVQDASASTVDQPVVIPLAGSDPNGDPLVFRVLRQPGHGTVGLVGRTATYRPEPGFAGVDEFSFVAFDRSVDSNVGRVTIARGATSASYGVGYPGSGGVVPALSIDARPVLGAAVQLGIGNSSGQVAPLALLLSAEPARISTPFGGTLLVLGLEGSFGILPAGGASLRLAVPTAAPLVGVQVHLQALQGDPGARFGIAFSRGLRLTLGR
jgi:hypothetical protein